MRQSYVYGDKTLPAARYAEAVAASDMLSIFSFHLDAATGGLGAKNRLPVPMPDALAGAQYLRQIRAQQRCKALLCFYVDVPAAEAAAPGAAINRMLTDATLRASAIATIVNVVAAHHRQDAGAAYRAVGGVSYDFEGEAPLWAAAFPAFVRDARAALVANGLPAYASGYLSTRYHALPVWAAWAAALDHVILPIYSGQSSTVAGPTDAAAAFEPKMAAIEAQLAAAGLPTSKLLYAGALYAIVWRCTGAQPGAPAIAAGAYEQPTIDATLAALGPQAGTTLPAGSAAGHQWFAQPIAAPDADPIVKKFAYAGRPVYMQYYWSTPQQLRARFDAARARGYGGVGYWYLGAQGANAEYLGALQG